MLAFECGSPAVLVSQDESDETQFYVLERSGMLWLPRFTPTSCSWNKASVISPLRLVDIEGGEEPIVTSAVHMVDRNVFVWSQAAPSDPSSLDMPLCNITARRVDCSANAQRYVLCCAVLCCALMVRVSHAVQPRASGPDAHSLLRAPAHLAPPAAVRVHVPHHQARCRRLCARLVR